MKSRKRRKINEKVRAATLALPEETQRQIVESYEGPLVQQVWNIPKQKLESVWCLDIGRIHKDYVLTSTIIDIVGHKYCDPKKWEIPAEEKKSDNRSESEP